MNKDEKKTAYDKVVAFFGSKDIKVEVKEIENKAAKLVEFAKDKESGTLEKFEELTLSGGGLVMIEPAVEMGAAIAAQTGEGEWVPAPPSEYELEDGRVVVVVEDGVVDSVIEVSTEDAPAEPTVDEEMGEENKAKRIIESIVKEQVFSLQEVINKQAEEIKFLMDSLEAKTAQETELKEEFTAVKTFVADSLKELYSEPVKEPVVKSNNPLKKEAKRNIFSQSK